MADGGWILQHIVEYPHNGSYAGEQVSMAQLQAGLETMANWSRNTDIALYNTRCLWFSIKHDTTDARLVVAYGGDDSSNNPIIHPDSDPYGDWRYTSVYEGSVWLCYIPASFSATALGTNPGSASFLPTNSLKFWPAGGYQAFDPTSARRNDNFVLQRDDNLIWARSNDSDADSRINRLHLMGECLDLRYATHPTEPDDDVNAAVAHLTWDDCYFTATFRSQFYLGGSQFVGGRFYYDSTLIAHASCASEPWTWMSPTIYISTNDLDTYGVITGNGIKGIISPEWFRYMATGPINDKQQLNGGDFINLRGGFVVGYDSSNGRMA